jgi:hypothetical protein
VTVASDQTEVLNDVVLRSSLLVEESGIFRGVLGNIWSWISGAWVRFIETWVSFGCVEQREVSSPSISNNGLWCGVVREESSVSQCEVEGERSSPWLCKNSSVIPELETGSVSYIGVQQEISVSCIDTFSNYSGSLTAWRINWWCSGWFVSSICSVESDLLVKNKPSWAEW